jgi:hypothetical protein
MESCSLIEASVQLRSMQSLEDGLEDTVCTGENVNVPESQYSEPI